VFTLRYGNQFLRSKSCVTCSSEFPPPPSHFLASPPPHADTLGLPGAACAPGHRLAVSRSGCGGVPGSPQASWAQVLLEEAPEAVSGLGFFLYPFLCPRGQALRKQCVNLNSPKPSCVRAHTHTRTHTHTHSLTLRPGGFGFCPGPGFRSRGRVPPCVCVPPDSVLHSPAAGDRGRNGPSWKGKERAPAVCKDPGGGPCLGGSGWPPRAFPDLMLLADGPPPCQGLCVVCCPEASLQNFQVL